MRGPKRQDTYFILEKGVKNLRSRDMVKLSRYMEGRRLEANQRRWTTQIARWVCFAGLFDLELHLLE
jgi:hypothetical protein